MRIISIYEDEFRMAPGYKPPVWDSKLTTLIIISNNSLIPTTQLFIWFGTGSQIWSIQGRSYIFDCTGELVTMALLYQSVSFYNEYMFYSYEHILKIVNIK